MPIADVRDFAKSNGIPMTAIKCSPINDENKGRVSKGKAVPHTGWKVKNRYEPKNVATAVDGSPATAWMLDLKKAGMFVIDIDVKGNRKAYDLLDPDYREVLNKSCSYAVETGSGGLHYYFKLPDELPEGSRVKSVVKLSDVGKWFIEPDCADVDIIVESIITEGSSYTHEGKTYEYYVLKRGMSIHKTSYHEEMWNSVQQHILVSPETAKRDTEKAMNAPVETEELLMHLDNIPNDKPNWDEWYRMAQTVFNILGESGVEVFQRWSQKCPIHSDAKMYEIWKGLKPRTDGAKLTMGTILFKSRQANEAVYEEIRGKFKKLSYAGLKQLLEEDHFFVEEPKPVCVRATARSVLEYSPRDFRELLLNWKYEVPDEKKDDKMKEVSFYESWSKDTEKRTYKRMECFPDPTECPPNVYNTFVPAEATFLPPLTDVSAVDLEPIFHHIYVMAGNDELGKEFILNYLAQIVQYPALLVGICILLYSEQGAGKDIIIEWFGSKVLGEHQYYMIGKASNLFGKFNADLRGKLLVHCDEVSKETMVANNDDLKRIITNGRIRIEAKGKDATPSKSYCRLFMTTNNRDALKIEESDRRFAVFRSSSEHKDNIDYFKGLAEHINKPEVVRACYDFLMKRDLSNFDHTKRPMTALYKEMKETSMDSIVRWIADAEDGFHTLDGKPLQQKTTDWLQFYNNWASANNAERLSPTNFGTKINELVEKKVGITKQKPSNVSKLTIDRKLVINYLISNGFIQSDQTPTQESV